MIICLSRLRIHVLSIVIFMMITGSAYTQLSHKHTVYADVNTSGPVYSVNYDRVFHQRDKVSYAYHVGVHWLHDEIGIPFGLSLITGKQNHHAELSITITPYVDRSNYLFREGNISDKYLYISPAIGYRFQKPNGGLFFKTLVAPLILLDPPSDDFWNMKAKVDPLLSLGFGYTF